MIFLQKEYYVLQTCLTFSPNFDAENGVKNQHMEKKSSNTIISKRSFKSEEWSVKN